MALPTGSKCTFLRTARPRRGLGLVALWGGLLGATGVGCDAGQLKLYTESTSATGGLSPVNATGGTLETGSGGMDEGMEPQATGGGFGGVQDHDHDHDDDPKDGPDFPAAEDMPCLLRGLCLPKCSVDYLRCEPCDTPSQCPDSFPVCDPVARNCVECVTNQDCLERFGPEHGLCSPNGCVQCWSEKHCAPGEFCFLPLGRCAECLFDNECEKGQSCEQGRCVDRK